MYISPIGSTNFSYVSNADLSKNTLDKVEKTEKHNVVNKNNMSRNNTSPSSGGKLKKNNLLESLMKQKENLMDSKNALMENASKNGDSPSSIKEILKEITKQIEEIDKQINNLQLEDQRKTLGMEEKSKEKGNSKHKSNNTSHNSVHTEGSADNILSLSNGLMTAKALSYERNKMLGSKRVLEIEIKTDEGRGLNPVRKKEHLAKMEDKIEGTTKALGNQLSDINTKINKDTELKNEQSEDIHSSTAPETGENLIIKQQQASQNVKKYVDNLQDNVKDNGEKINITA